MGVTRKEIKQTAKAALRNAHPHPVTVTLVFILISTGLSLVVPAVLVGLVGADSFFYWLRQGYSIHQIIYYYTGAGGTTALVFANVLINLFDTVLTFGYLGYILSLSRNRQAGFGNLLDGFGMAGSVILLSILTAIFTALWTMLLIVPGVIAFYRYRMAPYILLDDPECGALEAIRRSKQMMKGYKMSLFVFDLSFINWLLPMIAIGIVGTLLGELSYLLSLGFVYLASGLLGLWITPFFLASQSVFYGTLSGRAVQSRYGQDVDF